MTVTPPSDKNQPAASRRTPRHPRRPLRIVLLDDVPEVRQSIRTIIQAQFADAEIVECENGDEAWKIVQKSPPDLLITDLTHPGPAWRVTSYGDWEEAGNLVKS